MAVLSQELAELEAAGGADAHVVGVPVAVVERAEEVAAGGRVERLEVVGVAVSVDLGAEGDLGLPGRYESLALGDHLLGRWSGPAE